MSFADFSLSSVAPMAALTCLALIILLVESFIKKSENVSFWIAVLGLLLCIAVAMNSILDSGVAFGSMVTVGGYGSFFAILFLVAALLTIMLSRDYINKEEANFGEFYLLVLFATLGMMLIAAAADLIVVFLGIELMSICLYVLAGFFRKRMVSNESALKYFLLGAFATGFLLYGIALVYGETGTTNIAAIINTLSLHIQSKMFWIGIGMILIGLSFKVGAVPFHMWVPDVYQGAPTTISGFMSTGAKAAAFAAFLMLFAHNFVQGAQLKLVFSIVAAASMILGNIVALVQSNIKRMLAYSSIAHAGYILTGLAAGNRLGHDGILFYLVAYTFMNIGAFGIISLLEERDEKNLTFDDYAGLSTKKPLLAALMSIFMFSLAGIPPFAGFFGKYYVFTAAVNADLAWLAILGVLMSVVSVYYYLRLVVVMYFQDITADFSVEISPLSITALLLSCFAIIGFGLFPSSILWIIKIVS